jgi:hypothetical protein
MRPRQDATAAFNQFRLLNTPPEGALIQLFRHLREESEGSDSIYLHFAGDPSLAS